jgi:hypothetical protein
MTASSGVVFENDAMSEASCVSWVENPTRSEPARPADFPKTPNDDTASRAACFDCPSDFAAPSANFSSAGSEDLPNTWPVFETVSFRSLAALTAFLRNMTTAVPASAPAPAAKVLSDFAAPLAFSSSDASLALATPPDAASFDVVADAAAIFAW